MATNVTYSSLISDLQTYLERGDQTADQTVYNQLPRLINACERKIVQILKLQGVIEVLVDNSSIQSGVSIVAKPDRWRQTVSMSYGAGSSKNTRVPIYPRSYEYCRRYWPDDSVTGAMGTLGPDGMPANAAFYADYDYQHWLFAPTFDDAYPLETICYMQPVYLDANNQSNFFSEYTPNLLLYGSLLEAVPFLKGDERIPTWQNYWELEVKTLATQDLQKILDRAASRERP